MTIKIDKGIPLAAKGRSGGHSARYPFAQLEVGDSFFVSAPDPANRQRSLSGLCSHYAPKRFATRKVEGGVRVWRIA